MQKLDNEGGGNNADEQIAYTIPDEVDSPAQQFIRAAMTPRSMSIAAHFEGQLEKILGAWDRVADEISAYAVEIGYGPDNMNRFAREELSDSLEKLRAKESPIDDLARRAIGAIKTTYDIFKDNPKLAAKLFSEYEEGPKQAGSTYFAALEVEDYCRNIEPKIIALKELATPKEE